MPKLINRFTIEVSLHSDKFFSAAAPSTRTFSEESTNRMLNLFRIFVVVNVSRENLFDMLNEYKSASSMHAFCRLLSSKDAKSASKAFTAAALLAFGTG